VLNSFFSIQSLTVSNPSVFLEVQNLLDRKNVAEYIYADDGIIDTVYQWRFFFVGGVRLEF